jgi:adenylate kinase
MILVLLGPPGVGKGTQAERISVHYSVPTISTGVMFRDAVAKGTELGRIIQRYKIDKGEFVPDEVVIGAVRDRINQDDCVDGCLLDGFPRTVPQAISLDKLLEEMGRELLGALNFDAPLDVIVSRFSGRLVCPVDGQSYHTENMPPIQPGICDVHQVALVRRPDDEPEVVQRRIEIYLEKTTPLTEYYREKGRLCTIDANEDTETVFSNVVSIIDGLRKGTGC